ncbi:MAG: YgaP family membrane protein [Flavobacteriaceae bacterium]
MKKNMGGVDKVLRFLLGIAAGLLVYYEVITGPLSFVILVIVAVLLLTSLTGFCPLYGVLGINSCKARS